MEGRMSSKTTKAKNRENRLPADRLRKDFHPKAIAILGVSADENGVGFGTGMLRAIMAMGYERKIVPGQSQGRNDLRTREIFRKVEDIPDPVDLPLSR